MTKPGDRIVVAAAKHAPSRHGTVVECDGNRLVVDWDDGHRSSIFPAPGAVTVEGSSVGGPA